MSHEQLENWDKIVEALKHADTMEFKSSKEEEEYWENLSKEVSVCDL